MKGRPDAKRRHGLALALAVMAGIGVALPAAADEQDDKIAFYVAARVGAEMAEARCTGLRRNVQALKELEYYAGIFASDDDPIRQDTQRFRRDAEDQYAKLGATAWCEAVWKALGPNGELAKNVLERVKVEPPALRK